MKCDFPKCKREATHRVYWQHEGRELYMKNICEKDVKFEEEMHESIGTKYFLITDDKDPQEDKPLADISFRNGKRGLRNNHSGMMYSDKEDKIYLPSKISLLYKKDFKWFFKNIVNMITHEYLHSILNDFIDSEACRCLDNRICMDFEGVAIITCDHCWDKWKRQAMLKDTIIIGELAERILKNKKPLNKHYRAMGFTPYIRDKYWEMKYGE